MTTIAANSGLAPVEPQAARGKEPLGASKSKLDRQRLLAKLSEESPGVESDAETRKKLEQMIAANKFVDKAAEAAAAGAGAGAAKADSGAGQDAAFVAPSFRKQQTMDSGTFGMGTPKARNVVTPQFHRSLCARTPTTQRGSQATPRLAANVDTLEWLAHEDGDAEPRMVREAVAAAVENKIKYHGKCEMYSGKAQYEAPLDLNDDFLAMARKYGFGLGQASQAAGTKTDKETDDKLLPTGDCATQEEKEIEKAILSRNGKQLTFQDVIGFHADDQAEDEFYETNQDSD